MKKFLKLLLCAIFTQISAPAFAGPEGGAVSALHALAADLPPDGDNIPEPAVMPAGDASVLLADITEQCVRDYEVVSAFPKVYQMFPSEENARIIKVYIFSTPDGGTRRLEVYFTGSDWMRYGLVYFITNAGPDKDRASAYFIGELSTPDLENGNIAPAINPFDTQALVNFIVNDFLDRDGAIRGTFSTIASTGV